jgi:hypothetical protein
VWLCKLRLYTGSMGYCSLGPSQCPAQDLAHNKCSVNISLMVKEWIQVDGQQESCSQPTIRDGILLVAQTMLQIICFQLEGHVGVSQDCPSVIVSSLQSLRCWHGSDDGKRGRKKSSIIAGFVLSGSHRCLCHLSLLISKASRGAFIAPSPVVFSAKGISMTSSQMPSFLCLGSSIW